MAVSTDVTPSAASELPRQRGQQRPAWRQKLSRADRSVTPYAFIAPFFIFFFAFGLFPLLYTAYISLYKVELINPDKRTWRGLENFTTLLSSEPFWNAVRNTFTLGVLSTVPQLIIALGLAHMLNYKLRGSTFWRISMLMPYATSVAAATIIFSQLFGRDAGFINWAIGLFGFDPIAWEAGDWTSQIAIAVIVTWRWVGYNALIYLAAMQSIPGDLYESAAIDGANKWKQFRHVTVPMLKPTILFTVIVSSIGATQLFAEPLLLGGAPGARGGSDNQYQTLGLLMYQQGWVNGHLGQAAATAWTMFVLILVVSVVNALLVSGKIKFRRSKKAGA